MKILFPLTFLALGAFRGEAFAPIYGRSQASCQKPAAALFSAVPRFDNDSSQMDRDEIIVAENSQPAIPGGAVLVSKAMRYHEIRSSLLSTHHVPVCVSLMAFREQWRSLLGHLRRSTTPS